MKAIKSIYLCQKCKNPCREFDKKSELSYLRRRMRVIMHMVRIYKRGLYDNELRENLKIVDQFDTSKARRIYVRKLTREFKTPRIMLITKSYKRDMRIYGRRETYETNALRFTLLNELKGGSRCTKYHQFYKT